MDARSAPPAVERRAHRRLLCSEIVDVDLFLPDGRQISAKGLVNDISEGGLCLQFDGPVSSTGFVTIDIDDQQIIGAIRHSYERDESFFVGVSFVNYQWSPDSAWPSNCVPALDLTDASRDEESDLLRIARTVRSLR